MVRFDIAAYFNSVYHHDLISWFSEVGAQADDVEHFGQFLREGNSGRSVDCLPQGIHPCKLIGSEFLKFVDNSARLKSDVLLRFMDDFYLFSGSEEVINMDFVLIQQLLGERGLSLNPAKTSYESDHRNIAEEIDYIKIDLLKVRRSMIEVSGIEFEGEEEIVEDELDNEQIEYLVDLLQESGYRRIRRRTSFGTAAGPRRGGPPKTRCFLATFPGFKQKCLPFCRACGWERYARQNHPQLW